MKSVKKKKRKASSKEIMKRFRKIKLLWKIGSVVLVVSKVLIPVAEIAFVAFAYGVLHVPVNAGRKVQSRKVDFAQDPKE